MGVKYGDTLPLNNGNTVQLLHCYECVPGPLMHNYHIQKQFTLCKAHSALIKWGFEYN